MKNNGSQSQEPNLYERAVDNAIYNRRAKEFQASINPMQKTPFEEKLCQREADDRWEAKVKYIHGIQGQDGGKIEMSKDEKQRNEGTHKTKFSDENYYE